MTHAEHVRAVTAFGFTERQARFLVTVLVHAGVCLGRQYCRFSGIARGKAMYDFFEKSDLVRNCIEWNQYRYPPVAAS